MENFDDYVAKQAKSKHEREEAETALRGKAEADRQKARDAADLVFVHEIMPLLKSAERSLSSKVMSKAHQGRDGTYNVGVLDIGAADAPRKVELRIVQQESTYVLNTSGPYHSRHASRNIQPNELAKELPIAIKDAIDRWFGTNAYGK